MFDVHDRLGNVRQIIDSDGDVVKYYTYKPFGEVLESSHEPQATSNCFMFIGRRFDFVTGLYYYSIEIKEQASKWKKNH